MNDIGLTQISLSVPDLTQTLARVEEFGGSVVTPSVSARSAMIRDPDGQLLELLPDGWLSMVSPRPGA